MEEDYVMIPGSGTKKIIRDVKKEIETAFLDYSMSVIVSRALPDVRDGLKPVHRRILYTMHERGNDPSHAYRKSADTVGAVLGSYHPHGDASVYDAMVRLAQDFSLRYPLVDGQGNFGSVDGDPPAAYRYTEARMSRMAVEMLTDIEKDTIDWDPNFDETKKEPSVLPCRFPNLLVNGSQGIAVGMATNIPPHNLSEVIDGCIAYIDDPDIDLPGLMEHIKGPDFPPPASSWDAAASAPPTPPAAARSPCAAAPPLRRPRTAAPRSSLPRFPIWSTRRASSSTWQTLSRKSASRASPA